MNKMPYVCMVIAAVGFSVALFWPSAPIDLAAHDRAVKWDLDVTEASMYIRQECGVEDLDSIPEAKIKIAKCIKDLTNNP